MTKSKTPEECKMSFYKPKLIKSADVPAKKGIQFEP